MDQMGSSEKPNHYKDVYFYAEEAAQYKHTIARYTPCLKNSESIQGSSNGQSSIYEVDSKDFFIGLSSYVAPESKIAVGVVTGLVVLASILTATAPMLIKYLPASIEALLP